MRLLEYVDRHEEMSPKPWPKLASRDEISIHIVGARDSEVAGSHKYEEVRENVSGCTVSYCPKCLV